MNRRLGNPCARAGEKESCRKRKNEPEGAQIVLRARAEKTMGLE